MPLSATTCSAMAWSRGPAQKVLAFSLYSVAGRWRCSGPPRPCRRRNYTNGIATNLRRIPGVYGPAWSARLYHDLPPGHPLATHLCTLACSHPILDLCPVAALPLPLLANASAMFPMNWRFLPTLDPQVILRPPLHPRWMCSGRGTWTPG